MNRIPLKVVQETPELVECTDCGHCCTYVGIEIDRPTKVEYATDILWYLYHENVYIYVDGSNDWSVHFEARCRNLADDLLCRIYEQRPYVCRTQGLPLRWLDAGPSGETVEYRDVCPLNEGEGAPPIESLDPSACWAIGPVEGKLAQLQAETGDPGRRVPLRSLFA